MITLLNTLLLFLSSRWAPVALVLSAVTVVYRNVMGIIDAVHGIIAQADALTAPVLSAAGLSVTPFGVMNYLLPLDLGLALFGLWLPFFLACATLRFLKSWIPTIS